MKTYGEVELSFGGLHSWSGRRGEKSLAGAGNTNLVPWPSTASIYRLYCLGSRREIVPINLPFQYIEFIRQICKPWNQRSEMCNCRISSITWPRSYWLGLGPTESDPSINVPSDNTRHVTVPDDTKWGTSSSAPRKRAPRGSLTTRVAYRNIHPIYLQLQAARPSNRSSITGIGRFISSLRSTDRVWGSPSLRKMGAGASISELKRLGVKLTTHHHPVSRSGMRGDTPPFLVKST
jgi:hypothetical protein